MNWCPEHWGQLKAAVAEKGLTALVAKSGKEAAESMVAGKYDPLMDSWGLINSAMLQSPGLNGRILVCPCCILVADGQPHLVANWIDGATTESMNYALSQGYVKTQ